MQTHLVWTSQRVQVTIIWHFLRFYPLRVERLKWYIYYSPRHMILMFPCRPLDTTWGDVACTCSGGWSSDALLSTRMLTTTSGWRCARLYLFVAMSMCFKYFAAPESVWTHFGALFSFLFKDLKFLHLCNWNLEWDVDLLHLAFLCLLVFGASCLSFTVTISLSTCRHFQAVTAWHHI